MTAADGRQGVDAAPRRIEELIEALDRHPDASASGPARELVALVLDLHGIGLAKLVAILTREEGGASLLARLVEDDQVRSMLLLHGLHPETLETRIRGAVERLRPHLGVQGLRLEIVELKGGALRLRLHGGDGLKAAALWSLPGEIENAIVEAAPDVEQVRIEGLDPADAVASAAE